VRKLWLMFLFCIQSFVSMAEPLILVDAVALLKAPAEKAGIEGLALRRIMSYYPGEYQIEDISRNRARTWVKSHSSACIPWLKKTAEREQDFLFTLPYMLEDALQLVVLNGSEWQSILDKAGTISLHELLTQKKPPLLGIEANRSYGARLDPLLASLSGSRAIYLRSSSSEAVGSLLPMLEKGFIQLILEYKKIADRSGLDLRYYQLKEAEAVNMVYFACSKGVAGQAVVDMLDQAIQKASQDKEYRRLVLSGLKPELRQYALQLWLESLQHH